MNAIDTVRVRHTNEAHGAGTFRECTEPVCQALAALEKIANEPCDHGAGFCPREVATKAIGGPRS